MNKLSIAQYLQLRQDNTPTRQFIIRQIIRKFFYHGSDKVSWELEKAGYGTAMKNVESLMHNFITSNPEFKNHISWRGSTLTVRRTEMTTREYVSGLRKIMVKTCTTYRRFKYFTQYHCVCTITDDQTQYLIIDKILKENTDTILIENLIKKELANIN